MIKTVLQQQIPRQANRRNGPENRRIDIFSLSPPEAARPSEAGLPS
jgi:hypothetical protein